MGVPDPAVFNMNSKVESCFVYATLNYNFYVRSVDLSRRCEEQVDKKDLLLGLLLLYSSEGVE